MDDLIGRQLGLYDIVSQLGTGGMANVYKAYQPSVDRYVAVKVLTRLPTKEYEIFTSRFMQEAQVVAKLEHPHILPVYDFGETEDYLYLVMRLVNAGTLWDRFHGQPFPVELIRHIITQVGDALDYAHTQGIVHRDVKPKNILMDDRDNCLLTDFGIAKVMQTDLSLTQFGTTLGTPTYMSPEQIQGEPLDGRSDVYALGVILFQLATGHLPFEADTPHEISTKHLYAQLPSARAINPELPPTIESIIVKAMAKDPNDRYATAGDLVQAMKDLKFEKSISTPVMDYEADEDDNDQTTILTSLELPPNGANGTASEPKAIETIELDDLQPAEPPDTVNSPRPESEIATPTSLPQPDSHPVMNAQPFDKTERARTVTPGFEGSPPSFWQSRGLLIFGGVAVVVIVVLLGVLIGVNLNRSDVPVTSEAFSDVQGNASNVSLHDDFSQHRLEVTDSTDETGVSKRYEDNKYVVSVSPMAVADPTVESARNITFVGEQPYEDFELNVEITEISGKAADRSEDAAESAYGITFRNQGRNYYTLEVTGSGLIKLFRVAADEELNIAGAQKKDMKPGTPIQLHLKVIGPNFTVSLNDDEPYNFSDPAEDYLKQGDIGFVVNPGGNRIATVAFDNLEIRVFEPTEP
ncbi:MAG: serine/threonine protein kinase [Anaerolineae bacterium]|nr:serine/threonine protein kinase [Anaerolineae bacterium]